ncbi:MAG: serine/threonine-protein kinase PknK [Hyalangium sp.]|uniref:serine/threonine-protein kinase n=1 Tax=Hyalangium sp. TaxID=2028555 RepID=UPI00389AA79A
MDSPLKQLVPPSSPPSPGDLLEGTLIADRFTVERLAGRGGMGVVYRARDSLSSKSVALKLLHPAHNTEALQRFTREASLLVELQHPGIVSHVAHGLTAQGQPFLAMEWLEGEDLSQRLARQPLSLSETLGLIHRATQALAAVHQRGILHRDLKPSNLFLRAGDPNAVVVLDFGLARHQQTSLGMTGSRAVLGTLGYMAPEQASSEGALTPAVDVFSLGCVLYECLTGRAPFSAPHFAAVLAKILFAQPPSLRTLRPELPEWLHALVERLLAKAPQSRLPDAGALLALLSEPGTLSEPPHLLTTEPQSTALSPGSEQQLISVLLASPRAAASHDATMALLPRGALRDSLQSMLAPYGGRTELLADGSLVTTLVPERGTASDQAALAARCALLIKESWPEAFVVLTTGRGTLQKHLPVGEAMERAGQLLRQHEQWPDASGQVLLDETTAGLLGSSFQLSRPESGTFLLHGQQAGSDDSRPLLGRPTPCVGREQELSMLELLFTSCAEEPSARAVLVTAPAGMGKSRLRHEFLRRLERRSPQPLVLMGRGDPMSAGVAGGLLGQALRRLCDILDGEPLEVRQSKLAERLGRHVPAEKAQDVIEFLSELCGVPLSDTASARLRAARAEPLLMGTQVSRALVTFLQAECARGPVLLVLEDLHWGDALTVKRVDEALRELAEHPLMALALARPEAKELFPGLWAPYLQEFSLRGLSKKACARLAQEALGPRLSESTTQRIIEQAAGNALFLEELIRLVAEGREHSLPESVLAMLQSRILRLDAGARQVLLAGSIFGRSFWADGLTALHSAELRQELPLHLQRLVALEIIEPQPASRFPSEAEYRFRHALLRDAAYGLLPEEPRRLGHRLAGTWLEQRGEPDLKVLAEHYQLGGELEQAARCYAQVAEQLFYRDDPTGALRCVETALACGASGTVLTRLRALQASIAFWMDEHERCCALGGPVLSELPAGSHSWCMLIGSLIASAAFTGQQQYVAELAQFLLRTSPDPGALGHYILALYGLTMMTITFGARQQALAFISRMTQLAARDAAHDPLIRGWQGLLKASFEYYLAGSPWRALAEAEQAVAAFEEIGSRTWIGAQTMVGMLHVVLGEMALGVSKLRESLATAQQIGERFPIIFAQVHLLLALAASPEPALQEEARTLALEWPASAIFSHLQRGQAYTALAQLSLASGSVAEAEARAREACELLSTFLPYKVFTRPCLVAALLAQGRATEAREVARLGVQELEQLGGSGACGVALHLALAEACFAVDDASEGDAALRECLRYLRVRAEDISEPMARQHFLQQVPENRRVLELARQRWGSLGPHGFPDA